MLTFDLKNSFILVVLREVTSQTEITPYIHVLMNHAPYFIDFSGGLKSFSMDGVEQINHVHWKVFFRRTNHKKKQKRTISDQVSNNYIYYCIIDTLNS